MRRRIFWRFYHFILILTERILPTVWCQRFSIWFLCLLFFGRKSKVGNLLFINVLYWKKIYIKRKSQSSFHQCFIKQKSLFKEYFLSSMFLFKEKFSQSFAVKSIKGGYLNRYFLMWNQICGSKLSHWECIV